MPSYPGPQGGRAPPAELNFIPNPFIAEPIPAEKCKSCLPGPRHPRIRLRSNRPRRRSHLPSQRWRPARVTAFRRSSLRSLSASCSDLSPLGHTWNIPRDAWIRLSRAEENRAPITADIPRATQRIQAVSGIRCRFDSARTNAASIPHYRMRYGKYAYPRVPLDLPSLSFIASLSPRIFRQIFRDVVFPRIYATIISPRGFSSRGISHFLFIAKRETFNVLDKDSLIVIEDCNRESVYVFLEDACRTVCLQFP